MNTMGVANTSLAKKQLDGAECVYGTVEDSPTLWTSYRAPSAVITPVPKPESEGDGEISAAKSVSIVEDDLVSTLERAAEAVERNLTTAELGTLEPDIEAWCDLHGVDWSNREVARPLIARQAVMALWLRAARYEWYQRRDVVPPLSNNSRSGLKTITQAADFNAIADTVLDEVVWVGGTSQIADVVEARHRLLASTQPAEDIAAIYEKLIEKECRQALGQFRTRPEIGSLLRNWVTRHADVVLDTGIGAAALSRPFHPNWIVDTDPDQVVGIDRSPLAALMATTALTLSHQQHKLEVTNFLRETSNESNEEIEGIVANPPYTSHDKIDSEFKSEINDRAEAETGLSISSQSPLYAYFIYHSRQFLDPGDRAAFLIPQGFLSAAYGTSLKRFLVDEFDVKTVLRFATTGPPCSATQR